MDYVREELLRQQTVLELLMMGGSKEEAASESEEEILREREFVGGVTERPRRVQPTAAEEERTSARRDHAKRTASIREGSRLAEETVSPWQEVAEMPMRSETIRSSAREVSRAVQRDARRYDGGFTIY